jgi:diguanylate cyclase (GGDEF)-like protein
MTPDSPPVIGAPDPANLAEAIERQLAEGFPFLRFAPPLEAKFETDNAVERARHITRCGFIGIVIYDMFLISDWRMLPDVFWEACLDRLAIFTPLALAFLYIIPKMTLGAMREATLAVIIVLSDALMLDIFSHSSSPDRASYCQGTMLIMITALVVNRLRFPYAVIVTAALVAAQIITMLQSDSFMGPVLVAGIAYFVAGGLLLLAAAYALEHGYRRGYLLMTRGTILNRELERGARIDPLTGLWNRRHLSEAMQAAWAAAETAPTSMAVVLFDIDHFKCFNDTLGHLAGDACLKRVGDLCQRGDDLLEPRARKTAARFGGEEFLIFLPGGGVDEARAVADRLRLDLHAAAIPHPARGEGAIVTASFGIAAVMAPRESAAALIAAADTAMYKAKNEGRDRVQAADSSTKPARREPYPDAA